MFVCREGGNTLGMEARHSSFHKWSLLGANNILKYTVTGTYVIDEKLPWSRFSLRGHDFERFCEKVARTILQFLYSLKETGLWEASVQFCLA